MNLLTLSGELNPETTGWIIFHRVGGGKVPWHSGPRKQQNKCYYKGQRDSKDQAQMMSLSSETHMWTHKLSHTLRHTHTCSKHCLPRKTAQQLSSPNHTIRSQTEGKIILYNRVGTSIQNPAESRVTRRIRTDGLLNYPLHRLNEHFQMALFLFLFFFLIHGFLMFAFFSPLFRIPLRCSDHCFPSAGCCFFIIHLPESFT